MTYEKFRTQQETKNKNEENVLKNLFNNPMRFKDLKEKTNLSQMGLTTILKRLQEQGKIRKTLHEDHEAYELTEKGKDFVEGMWMILNEIYEMQTTKVDYESNYWLKNDIFWSLIREVESPQINYRDFIKRISEEYRKLILLEIKKTYLRENDDKTYSISEPEKLRGKHIIAFEVDFDLIRNNLEDALKPVSVDNKNKIGKYQSIADAIKEDIRNQYRNILFDEERKTIFHSEQFL